MEAVDCFVKEEEEVPSRLYQSETTSPRDRDGDVAFEGGADIRGGGGGGERPDGAGNGGGKSIPKAGTGGRGAGDEANPQPLSSSPSLTKNAEESEEMR